MSWKQATTPFASSDKWNCRFWQIWILKETLSQNRKVLKSKRNHKILSCACPSIVKDQSLTFIFVFPPPQKTTFARQVAKYFEQQLFKGLLKGKEAHCQLCIVQLLFFKTCFICAGLHHEAISMDACCRPSPLTPMAHPWQLPVTSASLPCGPYQAIPQFICVSPTGNTHFTCLCWAVLL